MRRCLRYASSYHRTIGILSSGPKHRGLPDKNATGVDRDRYNVVVVNDDRSPAGEAGCRCAMGRRTLEAADGKFEIPNSAAPL
jgi:hypothetical protein